MNIRLKQRLMLIAKKVPMCKTVCDIGTDHTYIPIWLIKASVCEKAVATDVKLGPIEIAKKNVKKFGLESSVQARVGDGLEPVLDNELDVIIIAGMGGTLISRILSDSLAKAKKAGTLLLQPMNCDEYLRRWLYQNGFEIFDEELAEEGHKIYNVIVAKWTGEEKPELDDVYNYIGKKLVENKDPLLDKLLDLKISRLDKAICEMDKAGVSSERARKLEQSYLELRAELK